ncbi:sulfur carrier protein ThiS [Lysobacter xanthus]
MENPQRVFLNGQPRELPSGTDVLALLEQEGLATRRVAVEVNGEIVPRGRHAGHRLAEGDRVEIVHALGGG